MGEDSGFENCEVRGKWWVQSGGLLRPLDPAKVFLTNVNQLMKESRPSLVQLRLSGVPSNPEAGCLI